MNAKEYNELVRQHADGIYRFALKNLREEAAAQDVVQDSFEKLWRVKESIKAESGKAWLFSTAYRASIDELRMDKRKAVLDESAENMHFYDQEYDGTADLLETALSKLPAAQRAVLMLRDYEGYNYAEIGEIASLSESQVKVYIHRARLFMRSFIEKMEAYQHVSH